MIGICAAPGTGIGGCHRTCGRAAHGDPWRGWGLTGRADGRASGWAVWETCRLARVAAGWAVGVAYRRRGGASGSLGQGADGRRPVGTGPGTQPEPRPPASLGQQGPEAGHALAQEAETPGDRPFWDMRRGRRLPPGACRRRPPAVWPRPAGPLEAAEALLNPVPAGIEGCVRVLGHRVRQQDPGVLLSRPVEHHQRTGQGVVAGRGHPQHALAPPDRGRVGRPLSLGPKGQGGVAAEAGMPVHDGGLVEDIREDWRAARFMAVGVHPVSGGIGSSLAEWLMALNAAWTVSKGTADEICRNPFSAHSSFCYRVGWLFIPLRPRCPVQGLSRDKCKVALGGGLGVDGSRCDFPSKEFGGEWINPNIRAIQQP